MVRARSNQPDNDGQQQKGKIKWKLTLRTLALAQPNRFKITKKYDAALAASMCVSAVSKGALKAKSTPRIVALAEPLKVSKKFDPSSVAAPAVYVKKAALKAKCSPRNEMLARNVLIKLQSTLEMFKDRGDGFLANMNKYIELARNSMYREMYWPKPPPPQEPPPLLRSCQFKMSGCPAPKPRKDQIAELEQWCKDNSQPKQIFYPPEQTASKRKALSELKKRLTRLALPKSVTMKFDEIAARQYTTGVRASALKGSATARVQVLAKPKAIKNPEPAPEGVSPNALTARASARVNDLAKPRERSSGPSDEKENPYGVKPEALKAYCSPRTKELAKPKERK